MRDMTFEYIPNGTPVLPGRFHRHIGHAAVAQPRPHLPKIPREGSEYPLLNLQMRPVTWWQHCHRDRVLVYIYAAAAAINCRHIASFAAERRTPGETQAIILLVFIRTMAETTVPGPGSRPGQSYKRVLTELQPIVGLLIRWAD